MRYYKYLPINLDTVSAVRERKMWVRSATSFNDPLEFRFHKNVPLANVEKLKQANPILRFASDNEIVEKLKADFEKRLHKLGVSCFSLSQSNYLLWSHYGDGHRGMCLEFDTHQDEDLPENAHRVIYRDEVPEYDFSDLKLMGDSAPTIICTKGKFWDYEEEIRFVHEECDDLVAYEHDLSGVIFGCLTSLQHRRLVESVIDSKIQVYKASLSDSRYALEVHPDERIY